METLLGLDLVVVRNLLIQAQHRMGFNLFTSSTQQIMLLRNRILVFISICFNVGGWDKGFVTLSSSVRENVHIIYRAETKYIFRMMTVDEQ